jgi:hypothetical protein
MMDVLASNGGLTLRIFRKKASQPEQATTPLGDITTRNPRSVDLWRRSSHLPIFPNRIRALPPGTMSLPMILCSAMRTFPDASNTLLPTMKILIRPQAGSARRVASERVSDRDWFGRLQFSKMRLTLSSFLSFRSSTPIQPLQHIQPCLV